MSPLALLAVTASASLTSFSMADNDVIFMMNMSSSVGPYDYIGGSLGSTHCIKKVQLFTKSTCEYGCGLPVNLEIRIGFQEVYYEQNSMCTRFSGVFIAGDEISLQCYHLAGGTYISVEGVGQDLPELDHLLVTAREPKGSTLYTRAVAVALDAILPGATEQTTPLRLHKCLVACRSDPYCLSFNYQSDVAWTDTGTCQLNHAKDQAGLVPTPGMTYYEMKEEDCHIK